MSDPITDAAKAAVEAMQRRMDDEFMMAATGVFTSTVEQPSEPLTLKRLALDMARATFDADVHITEFTPTPDKDGNVAGAYVIDNTQMPGWEMAQRVRVMRGELPGHAKTIVFPSVENALAAVDMAMKRQRESD